MKTINKKTIEWHGKTYFLLGIDEDGTKSYLNKASFDCGWYWGFGYINTFTNNKQPSKSRDIQSHSHLDFMLKQKNLNWYDSFKIIFKNTVLNDKETWQFVDLMRSFYTLKEAAEVFHSGNSHYTTMDALSLKDKVIEDKINKDLLPKIFTEIEKLLTEETNNE